MEKWEAKFTPEEREHIKKCWEGEPPKECTGKCEVVEVAVIRCCSGCDWDDLGVPMT